MKMGKKRVQSGDEDPLQGIKQLYSTEVSQDQTITPLEHSEIVVPQSHSTPVPEMLSTQVVQDQNVLPEELQSSEQSQDQSTPTVEMHAGVVPQSSTTLPEESQSGKRPGWKQMTIWVKEEMEPEMKLLSQFEGESISEMVRVFFQQRIETSRYRDLIREVMRKKAKIRRREP
jgi:hypothetical protein